MKVFLLKLKKNWDVVAIASCFFVIGALELFKPSIRPTGRWSLIGGFLWDRFGNLGVSFIFWSLGIIVIVCMLTHREKK